MIVVADTSPINYLLMIGAIHILPELYKTVTIPEAVLSELTAAQAPAEVRRWALGAPAWLKIRSDSTFNDPELSFLDAGECQAILLAERIKADAVIIDDRAGREEAGKRGLFVIGTLGLLVAASAADLIHLPDVLGKLTKTSFRASPHLISQILQADQSRKKER